MKPRPIAVIAAICSFTGLLSCEPDNADPSHGSSFFPLTENSQWEYLYTYYYMATDGTPTPYSEATRTIHVQGDTTLDGQTYKKLVDDTGEIVKIIRQEGSRYFGRNHELYTGFSQEYMFLDTSIPLNGTWSYIKDNGNFKTEYKVKALHSIHTFNGNLFQNVTEIEVTYYNLINGVTPERWYTTRHYYAKGIGEIYAFYPYPASGTYSDLDISLVKSN